MWPNNADVTRCPVATYKKYAKVRPISYSEPFHPFYIATHSQFCDADCEPGENCTWFRSQPIGVNKLSSLMKKMSEQAEIRHLTNHSARKHLVQKLNDAGVHPNQIMQVTGHRNIASINNYSTITVNQQKGISEILSDQVKNVPVEKPATLLMPPSIFATESSSPTLQVAQPSIPGPDLFRNCHLRVETMNINVNYVKQQPTKRRRINVIESDSSQE